MPASGRFFALWANDHKSPLASGLQDMGLAGRRKMPVCNSSLTLAMEVRAALTLDVPGTREALLVSMFAEGPVVSS